MGSRALQNLKVLWVALFALALTMLAGGVWSALVVAVIGMASLVAAVAEEAGFRGYLQGILEQKVSGPLAILITALAIAPGHGSTQGFAWPTILFYLCVDAMLGTMAYLTSSILPGIVIHAAGLVVFFSLIWPNDPTRQLIESSGTDLWFWIHFAQTIIFAGLAILAFQQLARITKRVDAGQEPGAP
jgi:hypothetical protein